MEPKRLTLAQLKEYDGSDKKKPIYLAIRGVIFDVSKGELHSRSKARASPHASRTQSSGNTVSLAHLMTVYCWSLPVLIRCWALKSPLDHMSLRRIAAHAEGNCPAVGAEFYGPDGMYPFAGHECARAFALISTDTADCHDNLEVCCSSPALVAPCWYAFRVCCARVLRAQTLRAHMLGMPLWKCQKSGMSVTGKLLLHSGW